jgi:hypothetical protein
MSMSDPTDRPDGWEEAWAEEADRRADELESGEVTPVPGDVAYEGAARRMHEEYERHPGCTLQSARAGVGPGWRPLVEDMWTAITQAGGRVTQAKEKLASLRIYWDRVPDAMAATIDGRYEQVVDEAERTCEWCGAPGELRDRTYQAALPSRPGRGTSWWFKTLCAEHAWRYYVDDERPWLEGEEW